MKNIGHNQSVADPCIYFSRNREGELAIWQSWVDDNLVIRLLHAMKDEHKKLAKEIKMEYVRELKEFFECKVDIDKSERPTKLTKPVTIQSFLDKFSKGKKKQVTPAELGTV